MSSEAEAEVVTLKYSDLNIDVSSGKVCAGSEDDPFVFNSIVSSAGVVTETEDPNMGTVGEGGTDTDLNPRGSSVVDGTINMTVLGGVTASGSFKVNEGNIGDVTDNADSDNTINLTQDGSKKVSALTNFETTSSDFGLRNLTETTTES